MPSLRDGVPLGGVGRGFCARGGLRLQSHLPLRASLIAGVRISESQLIMAGRVVGLHLHVALERSLCLGELTRSRQRHAEREVRFGEADIKFCGAREAQDRLIPCSGSTRQLSQNKFRRRVGGIYLEFLLEFRFGIIRGARVAGYREIDLAKAVMNAGNFRILREYLAINFRSVLIFSLGLERLRFESALLV